MKIVRFLIFLIAPTLNAQTKIFDLESGGRELESFIADKNVIIVGEMHGTTEVPTAILQLVKQAKEKQRPLIVALEISSNCQKEIDAFLTGGDFNDLLKLDYFQIPDGRTSIAMGELIKGLREIKGVRILCFDIPLGSDMGVNRDSLMGINLSQAYHGDQMFILTGNLHANLKEGYWRPNFKSAAYYFNKSKNLGDKLISLNTYFGGGTIWTCMQDGCKQRDAYSNANLKQPGLTNFIAVYPEALSGGYSGFIYFDKVTASKPMVN